MVNWSQTSLMLENNFLILKSPISTLDEFLSFKTDQILEKKCNNEPE